MSKKQMIPLQTLHEDGVLNNDDIVPRDANRSDLELMNRLATTGNLDKFEKMFKLFNPTAKMWEMRMLANAKAFDNDHDHGRQFQRCLQVANDMQAIGYTPTDALQSILTDIARSPQQQQKLRSMPWYTLPASTTTPKGGRSKIRRQIRTRALARFIKSKKCRERRARRTRNRNHS